MDRYTHNFARRGPLSAARLHLWPEQLLLAPEACSASHIQTLQSVGCSNRYALPAVQQERVGCCQQRLSTVAC